jgi:Putative mono-oxygenase ydhR
MPEERTGPLAMTAAGECAIPAYMPKPPDKQDLDRELDFELEETFPASDPLDVTRPAPHRKKPRQEKRRLVMIVTFPWDAPEEHRESVAQARELAARGEFLSKLILRDAATKRSGAVYVFADRAAAEKWRDDLRRRRGPDVEARIFEVNEEASKLTRG